jgi:hypothetical protein
VPEANPALLYQLQLRAQELCMLCVEWERNVSPIPCQYPMLPSWGPTEQELHNAAAMKYTPGWDSINDDIEQYTANPEHDSSSDINTSNDEEEVDELVDLMEAAGLADEYRAQNDDLSYNDTDDLYMTEDFAEASSSSSSPCKRQRILK